MLALSKAKPADRTIARGLWRYSGVDSGPGGFLHQECFSPWGVTPGKALRNKFRFGVAVSGVDFGRLAPQVAPVLAIRVAANAIEYVVVNRHKNPCC